MCFCCCDTRKRTLIYAIVISSLAFIYGIFVITKFGSRTDVYKALIKKIEFLEAKGYTSISDDFSIYYNYYYDDDEYYDNSKDDLDAASMAKILSINYIYLQNNSYGLIKRLEGFENGLGIILYIFSFLFLISEIVYIAFVCGIRETQLLKTITFNVFNIFKIITKILSIIFIFLGLLYCILLSFTFFEYISFIENLDSCGTGIIIGIIFGFYNFIYYIILASAFSIEYNLFKEVGSVDKPGPKAQYDVFGNPIIRAAIVVQQVVGDSPQIIGQPMMNLNLPYQQVPNQNYIYNYNQINQQRESIPVVYSQQPSSQEPSQPKTSPSTPAQQQPTNTQQQIIEPSNTQRRLSNDQNLNSKNQ